MYACPWSRGNTNSHGTAYSVKTSLCFELSPAKLFTSMPITDCGWRLHSKWRMTRPKRHAIVPNSKPITQSSDPRDLDPGKKTGALLNGSLGPRRPKTIRLTPQIQLRFVQKPDRAVPNESIEEEVARFDQPFMAWVSGERHIRGGD